MVVIELGHRENDLSIGVEGLLALALKVGSGLESDAVDAQLLQRREGLHAAIRVLDQHVR